MGTDPFLNFTASIASILVHIAFKGSIILLVIFAITHWLDSPIQRHFAWRLAFGCLLALPIVVILVPPTKPI